MYPANPYQQYKEQSISTLSQGELLVKLYDELIKQMRTVVLNIEKKNYGPMTDAMIKAQAIVATLESSLDKKYDLSNNLREFYIFLAKQLMDSNVKKDATVVEACIPLVRDLRESFEQADKASRKAGVVGGHAV